MMKLKQPLKKEKRLGDNARIHIQNTDIDVLTMDETVALTERYILANEPLHLIGINADKINELNDSPEMKEIVNSCGIINADGASVILASRFLKQPLPERVAGIDLMERLIQLSSEKGYRVYLLGAKEEVVRKTAEVYRDRYPKLNLVGVHNGYFKEEDWESIAELLKESKAQIVFVGITSPLKEYLVEYLQSQGLTCVFMGVGGSFDVISGNIPRAPLWMQKANLEWLFRMVQEPKRLMKRYLIGNTRFVASVLKERIHGRN